MEIGFLKKWCDNHAYSGLMQRIICELSNLSNKLKDKLKETKSSLYDIPIRQISPNCYDEKIRLISSFYWVTHTQRHLSLLVNPFRAQIPLSFHTGIIVIIIIITLRCRFDIL